MTERHRVLIVEARFYEDIADDMMRGAAAELDAHNVDYESYAVPGAFEIPAAIRFAVRSMEVRSALVKYSGFIALGCVIRGETDHYDYICREASRALMDLTVAHSIAFGFGLLTCDTYEQARVRAAVDGKNKGGDAARACLRMMELKQTLRLVPR